ncbi:unnamed protein product, partial [Dracunculus medinensis]|uniref:ATP-binding protein n=1 Tax=Dracunculus medinensis TaxID=318479 RepID=A0A0N4URR3_DRAME
MENVADELVKEIGNSVLKQEIENVQKQIAARLDKQRLKNSVNQWKKYVAKRKEQAFLRNFPVVAVPRLTIQRGCSI